MLLPNARGQQNVDQMFDASTTTTGAAQLVVPIHKSRSHLVFCNLSTANNMYLEFGSARAMATLTSGAVTSCTITNGGFNFTKPPKVKFLGGGYGGNTASIACGQPGYPAPGDGGYAWGRDQSAYREAKAHAVLTGGAVTSIVIEDGGAGYGAAPFVFLENDALDPFGCASPFYSSTASGLLVLAGGGSYYVNGTACPTDSIAVYCSASGQPFTFKWMA